MSTQKALSLLISSLERSTKSNSKEWELLSSILDRGDQWNQSIFSLIRESEALDVCPLHILNKFINRSSVEDLQRNTQKLVDHLTQQLQNANDVIRVKSACECFSSLLDRSHCIQKGTSDFTSKQLPTILSSLIWFTAADTHLQCVVLPLVAKCVVYYPKPCGQFKGQLTKWINAGLFSSDQSVSQECSRLLVLVYGLALTESLITELHVALSTLCDQDIQSNKRVSVIDIPSIPSEEPGRTALLLRLVCVLSRTLCYSLLFPTSSGHVPLSKILGVVLGGLEVGQQQVTGLSYDKLLLHSVFPTVHSSLWGVLTTLINSCHTHLLPYTTVIESCIAQGLTSNMTSESVILSIHRCLCAWLSVRRDADNYFMTLTTSSLLKTADSSDHSPTSTQLSALSTLCSMVRSVGVFFPPPVSNQTRQLALKGISLTTPPELSLRVLDLLLACLTSSNSHLCQSTSRAMGMFSIGTQYQSAKVREFCQSALTQCELIRHPMVPPLLSPHTKDTHQTTALLVPEPVNYRTSLLATPALSTTSIATPSGPTGSMSMTQRQLSNEAVCDNTSTEPAPVTTNSNNLDLSTVNTSMHADVLATLDTDMSTSTTPTLPNTVTEDTTMIDLDPSNKSSVQDDDIMLVGRMDEGEMKDRSISISSDDSIEEDLKLFIAVPPDDPIED